MQDYLRRLSPLQEFFLIIAIGFGWFIYSSLSVFMEFFTNNVPEDPLATTPEDLYSILMYEILALVVIGILLHLRQWKLWQFQLQVTLRTTLAGIALAGVDMLIYMVLLIMIFEPFFPASNALYPDEVVASLDVYSTALFSLINGCYEETLVVGYVYLALAARKGFALALFTSLSIRLLYHLYQGPIALISVLPMGLLFFILYARFRRLWPLVLAHGLLDFTGMWDEICFGDECSAAALE